MVDRGRSPASRREDILAAAEQEFAVAGYAGARMERIAAAARVNKQLLFHYFDSKDGLFGAALARMLHRLEPPPAPADASPVTDLRATLWAIQSAAARWPGVLATLAADGQGDPESVRAASVEWRSRLTQRLARTLEDGQRRGHFRDDLDPAATARLALAAALGAGALGGSPPVAVGAAMTDYCAWR
jgi:TetR/AcrR family transcriptional regulator